MKALIHKLSANPKYSRAFEWGKLISIAGSAQVLVQGAGLLTGILIIRMLPTKEYAYYTLANTMLGTMTVLADGGISSGVMSQGGKVWNDKVKLGQVLATGLDLRKKFAVFSLIVAVPILMYLLWHQGASNWTIALVVLTLIPSFFAALSDSLLEIVPKLHQDIKPLQFNQSVVSILRLFLSSVSIFFFPFTFIALLGNGIPRIFGNFQLRKIAFKFADKKELPNPEYRSNILNIVKKTLPGSIYYCLSGQIQIWLISIFGSTESIAHVGALGRLTMVMTMFSILFNTLLEPRFARLPNQTKLVKARFLQLLGLLILTSVVICGLVWLFPAQILSVLGKSYAGLDKEVLLITLGSCLSLISGTIYRLNSTRGIIPNPYFFIPSIIITQAIVLCIIDLSVVTNVLWFSIIVSAVGSVIRITHFYWQIGKVAKV